MLYYVYAGKNKYSLIGHKFDAWILKFNKSNLKISMVSKRLSALTRLESSKLTESKINFKNQFISCHDLRHRGKY
jgi:hypothetical protein